MNGQLRIRRRRIRWHSIAADSQSIPKHLLMHCQKTNTFTIQKIVLTCSALALHCCTAHSNINRKMENSTPCKMVTPENFILKLGTRDDVQEVTYYTIFDGDRLSGGLSPNRWNITLCDFFYCPVLFFILQRPARTEANIHALWLIWRGSAQGRSWVGRTNVTYDRQTDDRRQTDGRAIAYSEREREFTFAKN